MVNTVSKKADLRTPFKIALVSPGTKYEEGS